MENMRGELLPSGNLKRLDEDVMECVLLDEDLVLSAHDNVGHSALTS